MSITLSIHQMETFDQALWIALEADDMQDRGHATCIIPTLVGVDHHHYARTRE